MLSKANLGNSFIRNILDGMTDWVRVIDRNDKIIYLNKAMEQEFSRATIGKKCYEIFGRKTPCGDCISRKAVFEGIRQEKIDTISGRIFSVKSSPVKNSDGDVIAVVEVFHDITQIQTLNQRITEQNESLLNALNAAKMAQISLLPKKFTHQNLNFKYLYLPCESLSGDFIDIFEIDNNHTGVYIADVSGHGILSSMLTVFMKSTINKKILSPSNALKELHNEFNKSAFDKDLYITVFYAIINTVENKIIYSNAGHNGSPILFNKSKLEVLHATGTPIGSWVNEPDYSDNTIDYFNGDSIFFHSDGITDLRNNNSEQFGEKRIADFLSGNDALSEALLNDIIEKAFDFAGIKNKSSVPDDITIALLQMN